MGDRSSTRGPDVEAMSVAEVQAHLGICRGNAYALAREIGVRVGGPGGRLLVSRAKLAEYLAGRVDTSANLDALVASLTREVEQ